MILSCPASQPPSGLCVRLSSSAAINIWQEVMSECSSSPPHGRLPQLNTGVTREKTFQSDGEAACGDQFLDLCPGLRGMCFPPVLWSVGDLVLQRREPGDNAKLSRPLLAVEDKPQQDSDASAKKHSRWTQTWPEPLPVNTRQLWEPCPVCEKHLLLLSPANCPFSGGNGPLPVNYNVCVWRSQVRTSCFYVPGRLVRGGSVCTREAIWMLNLPRRKKEKES